MSTVASMLKLGLLGAASLTALLLPLSPANASAGGFFTLLARQGSVIASKSIGNVARTEGFVMGTALRTGSRFEARALITGSRFEAGAFSTLRRNTPAPQMGAVEIEGESLAVVGLNRANKAADELPSAKPAGESAYSFEVFSGKLTVGTLIRLGNLAIKGGEIKTYPVITGAAVAAYFCNMQSCDVDAVKDLVREIVGAGIGSLIAGARSPAYLG
jgi:hypothetical protein